MDANAAAESMDDVERELYADDDEGMEEEASQTKVAQRKLDDEDDEEDEEDDEEDEDDEGLDTGRPKKKTKVNITGGKYLWFTDASSAPAQTSCCEPLSRS